ncbi:MAG TPA: NAD-dependent epimerase/dehydratase family protein [Bryobacteraceae bacterium]|nr:NAD-dependent epimerase/dehydratase family protein [Bryobacteraceae bacterium]
MILVTGGTGFIGSHLVEALAARGEAVRVLLRRSSPKPHPAADCSYGDLTTGAGLEGALDGVDSVIHLAGVTRAIRSADYYAGNTRATELLLRAMGRRALRFVHVSSLAAAGPCAGDVPVTEEDAPRPLTPYGKSKWEAEKLVRERAPQAVIIRPPVVYGGRDTGVLQVLKPISQGIAPRIAGGERRLSMIYVKDLVAGLLAAEISPVAAGRTYFLAHPRPVTWSELGAAAASIMGRDPIVLRVPLPLARAIGFGAEIWGRIRRRPSIVSRDKIAEAACSAWVCDSRRAAGELGFEAQTSLDAGLRETLAWYKEAGWLRY